MSSNQDQSQLRNKLHVTSPAEGTFSRGGLLLDFCDLHVHTTASDGHLAPGEVVQQSVELGLKAVSICDHDTMSGYLQLARMYPPGELGIVRLKGLEVIPGIEINSKWEQRELHILGYFVDPLNETFSRLLASLAESRLQRVHAVVERLASLGMPVQVSRVLELSQGDSVGRPHVAQAMMEKGYVSSTKQAFKLYLGIGKPAYVDRHHLSPAQSIKAIRAAGGIAVWAHPGITDADWLVHELMEHGLQGIEVYHSEHDEQEQQKYLNMARENGLVVTGGSDFHGPSSSEGAPMGSFGISYQTLETLKRLVAAY
ncbi:MAG: PHP domain-containing protein [Firmicutes bacterium]|nr:PHP domain-containing protein [Candidatus Fermentithermobacillaceae bacterium]